MKKLFLLVSVSLLLIFSSCNKYVCPTYDNQTGEQKYKGKGKPKSNTSQGLFPKNM